MDRSPSPRPPLHLREPSPIDGCGSPSQWPVALVRRACPSALYPKDSREYWLLKDRQAVADMELDGGSAERTAREDLPRPFVEGAAVQQFEPAADLRHALAVLQGRHDQLLRSVEKERAEHRAEADCLRSQAAVCKDELKVLGSLLDQEVGRREREESLRRDAFRERDDAADALRRERRIAEELRRESAGLRADLSAALQSSAVGDMERRMWVQQIAGLRRTLEAQSCALTTPPPPPPPPPVPVQAREPDRSAVESPAAAREVMTPPRDTPKQPTVCSQPADPCEIARRKAAQRSAAVIRSRRQREEALLTDCARKSPKQPAAVSSAAKGPCVSLGLTQAAQTKRARQQQQWLHSPSEVEQAVAAGPPSLRHVDAGLGWCPGSPDSATSPAAPEFGIGDEDTAAPTREPTPKRAPSALRAKVKARRVTRKGKRDRLGRKITRAARARAQKAAAAEKSGTSAAAPPL